MSTTMEDSESGVIVADPSPEPQSLTRSQAAKIKNMDACVACRKAHARCVREAGSLECSRCCAMKYECILSHSGKRRQQGAQSDGFSTVSFSCYDESGESAPQVGEATTDASSTAIEYFLGVTQGSMDSGLDVHVHIELVQSDFDTGNKEVVAGLLSDSNVGDEKYGTIETLKHEDTEMQVAPDHERNFILTENGRFVPGLGLILREEEEQDGRFWILYMRDDVVHNAICEFDYTVVEILGTWWPKADFDVVYRKMINHNCDQISQGGP